MTILSSQPPPSGTAPAEIKIKDAHDSRVPVPVLFLGRGVRTLWSNGKARVGMVLLGLFVLMAVFAPLLAPHSPTATTFTPYQNPNGTNWFGTTGNGEDVFSQLIYGSRVSLLVGLSAGIGATLGARTGSPEAVQGAFPLMFAVFFLSSMSMPRDLIAVDWFRTVATWNPASYLIEGLRSLVITGWDATALWRGLAVGVGVLALSFWAASRALATRMART